MRFRKKPIVIEAVQYTGSVPAELDELLSDASFHLAEGSLFIRTLEGQMEARNGDWIIRGVKGECYPCKPDIFEATYEAVT